MTDDLAFISATELLARYRQKALSPVEVMGETLRRLERYEGALNAFVLYDPEAAAAQARASEARWQKGVPQGLLDGVPVAIKDTLLTLGWPRLMGSRTIDPHQAWDEDAPVPARLRAQGAVFFGKTTTPEFGWKGVTDSLLTGVTRNPWNLERTPGGSRYCTIIGKTPLESEAIDLPSGARPERSTAASVRTGSFSFCATSSSREPAARSSSTLS